MSFFDIDYDMLSTQLLPVRLRNGKMTAWMKCLAAPVKWLYNLFRSNRAGNLYILKHNSQVVYLQAALNDVFDPLTRLIYIDDGPYRDPLFTYLATEEQPLWLGLSSEAGSTPYPDPQILYTSDETSLLGVGFIVKVPLAVSFDIRRMRALINKYRLPGSNTYTIETY